MVDISYGGENGFNQAIELAAESLANVKFIQEKKLIGILAFLSKVIFKLNVVGVAFLQDAILTKSVKTQGSTALAWKIH